jgi:DNA-directed RNA polymerase specialized sigma24 family protein
MPKMSLRKPYFARAASSVVFRVEMRAWLLQIVRNTCYSWLEKNRPRELMVEFNEELHQQPVVTPESIAIASEGRERLIRALETLPPRYRELSCFENSKAVPTKRSRQLSRFPWVA